MPDMHAHNGPLYMTAALWIFNFCVGPNGWFSLWTGIQAIFASIAELCGVVFGWIWQNVAFLGVSFGEYVYAKLDAAAMLQMLTDTGTGLQRTGIIVSGLLVSCAVLALGNSVWTFGLYSNTVSQRVLSVHAVRFFLPLVLAWIVLGLVRFDTAEHAGSDSDVNDGNGDQSGLDPDKTNQNVDPHNGASSQQRLVFPVNGREVAYGGVVYQQGGTTSDTPRGGDVACGGNVAYGGDVACGGDNHQQGGTASVTPRGVLKRGRADTESDNGASEKYRKVDNPDGEMMDTK